MPYRLELRPQAVEDIRHLDKAIAQRILRRLKWLCENFDSLRPEGLSGPWEGLFKMRVGSYRALYTAAGAERLITVHLIGHRRDVYRRR